MMINDVTKCLRAHCVKTKIRWPRGIMGFTHAFRNLQGKFSTAIATLNFQPRFNFSLFQLPRRNRYFQRSTAVATFNRDSVFQRSAAIPTFNRDPDFQRSAAIPTFNRDSVFQLSTAIGTLNRDSTFQRSSDCNFQPRFGFSTRFQLLTAIRLSTAIRLFNAQL